LVNRLFRSLMTPDTTDMEYTEDEALVKGSSYEGPLSYPPRLSLVETLLPGEEDALEEPEEPQEASEPSVDEEIEDLKAAELEALNAVRLIREYHGKTVHDDKKNCDRPLAYRDMVILLRAVKGDGEVFYKTLSEAGIPVFLDRSEGYFDAVEIQVFLNLLRIIDNRSQDVPLLSVLRSPVFGFSASELAQIRIWAKGRGETRTPYNRVFAEYQTEGPDGPLKDKCLAFAAKLDRWRMLSRHMPLGDFLWELLTDSGYASFASAVPAGTQRLANLRALADKAQQYESDNAGGLYGFINYVDAINDKGGKVDVGQVKILSESEDVVRIMTIHKSKGLEFPFVLLAGLGKKFGGTHMGKAEFHKSFGAAMRLVQPGTGLYCDPLSLRFIRRKKDAEEMAENIRVLYVALTRPKDIVLMSATVKHADAVLERAACTLPGDVESCSGYVNALLPLLPEGSVEIVPREKVTAQHAAQTLDRRKLAKELAEGFHVAEDELPVTKEEIAYRLNFDYEPPEEQKEKRKYSVSQIAAMERERRQALPKVLTAEGEEETLQEQIFPASARDKVPAFLFAQKGLNAAARGTAYHTVMEHLPFTPEGKDAESIRAFMEDLVEKGLLTDAEFAAVDPHRVSAFFGSQTGREALAAKELYKEQPFTIRHELEGRQVLVQGTIDCCFMQGDGWVLVDYKS
ncbi:MAG: PD-(D/E)XK nuclease family protein, partial [Firmicutes bacterium]|nr:PD-(D/E)XK nuclease family protein [Bacillota bacterium]